MSKSSTPESSYSGLAASNRIETFQLGPVTTPRIWTGLWQLSSSAWGCVPVAKIREGMARHVQSGYNTFGESSSFVTVFFG
jgi:hypothetical protein